MPKEYVMPSDQEIQDAVNVIVSKSEDVKLDESKLFEDMKRLIKFSLENDIKITEENLINMVRLSKT